MYVKFYQIITTAAVIMETGYMNTNSTHTKLEKTAIHMDKQYDTFVFITFN